MRTACTALLVVVAAMIPARAEEPAPDSKPALRQFQIKVRIVEDGPESERVLAQPTLITLEGRPATFMVGGEMAFTNKATNEIETIPFGVKLTASVAAPQGGKIRVDCELERSEVISECRDGDDVAIHTKSVAVRMVRAIRLGRTIDVEFQETDKRPAVRAELTVTDSKPGGAEHSTGSDKR
jgi:hypothetical protein